MSKSLLAEVIAYLQRQQALGKKKVYRTVIYAVMEDRFSWNADGRPLSVQGLRQAAQAVGGTYINDNGRARVVF